MSDAGLNSIRENTVMSDTGLNSIRENTVMSDAGRTVSERTQSCLNAGLTGIRENSHVRMQD